MSDPSNRIDLSGSARVAARLSRARALSEWHQVLSTARTNDELCWALSSLSSAGIPGAQAVKARTRRASLDGFDAAFEDLRRPSLDADMRSSEVLIDATCLIESDRPTTPWRLARTLVRESLVADGTSAVVAYQRSINCWRQVNEPAQLLGQEAHEARLGSPVVPWHSALVVPDAAGEPARANALLSLSRYSNNQVVAIGYDCSPITTAETVAPNAPDFMRFVSWLKESDLVLAVSRHSVAQFEGLNRMLEGTGLPGPEVELAGLDEYDWGVGPASLDEARDLLSISYLPAVLSVGSGNPRNHRLSILRAAESLWRRGRLFTLHFVGSPGHEDPEFSSLLARCVRSGRPLTLHGQLPDALLGSAYALATFTVVAAEDEGFSLPIAESVAAGTPVVASRRGPNGELAERGGVHLVDANDERCLAAGMDALLMDEGLLASLRRGARDAQRPSPAEYARHVVKRAHASLMPRPSRPAGAGAWSAQPPSTA